VDDVFMSEQSHSVIDDAVAIAGVLRRRVLGGGVLGGGRSQDVWAEATREEDWRDHIATGAEECRYCPVCRAIAAARSSRPDVVDGVVSAGGSFMNIVRDALDGFDRNRPSEDDGPVDAG
jgi:hypothetical protein